MPRKLLVINGLLLLIAGASAAFVVRQIMAPMAMPLPSRTRPPAPVATREETPRSQAGAYVTVAARNLFSPTRSEGPPTATTAAAPAVKPNLFGVVLRDGTPIAYLEDPATKRVAGYRVGDAVAGGTVQTIAADNVVISRPDGNMDVRLRDPSRPRPAVTAGQPGVQPVSGGTMLPGVIPPAGSAAGTVPGQVVTPGPGMVAPPPGQEVQPSSPPVVPRRRPLPPNLLRRLPQGLQSDAPQQ